MRSSSARSSTRSQKSARHRFVEAIVAEHQRGDESLDLAVSHLFDVCCRNAASQQRESERDARRAHVFEHGGALALLIVLRAIQIGTSRSASPRSAPRAQQPSAHTRKVKPVASLSDLLPVAWPPVSDELLAQAHAYSSPTCTQRKSLGPPAAKRHDAHASGT